MNNSYTPRRFGKRWREDCPDYILDILDNKGKSADRYTIFFTGHEFLPAPPRTLQDTWIQYLALSENPSHPQGVSLWGELKAWEAANVRYKYKHQRIRWLDLPENIRSHIISRATEA